ncbi:ATP-binding protein [Sphingobacterium faecium]|uniref:ATP-binding protein n=1 Tax=Sphingobacterium faecium TaxID=34087 RepID=UPI00320ADA5F
MSKHTEISQQLKAMEQGRFQIVCIEYLKSNIGGMIHSPGTVDGKEKTRKGHPDIYLKQDDGKYVLGECTTKDNLNISDFNAKLEADLRECLKFEKLQIPQEKVDSIYLCCNSSVDTGVFEHLESITKNFGIGLRIISLYDLAHYFSSAGKVFAKDYMGIGFLTGQVLNKANFLKQYHKKNLSTPLDNPIVGRENELSVLVEQLNNNDLILVNGPAGIGKSRLVIEAIDIFLKQSDEFTSFYIFPKSGEITEDLATFLRPGKSYILFIDDANRQLNSLIKVLEKFVESEVRLKIIMTVRDYAKEEVIMQCGSLKPNGFILSKLSDETIKQIISHEPFLINNWEITNRIIQISDGNPRLAIMAAEIMKLDPNENVLGDVTRIYDAYFDNILIDKEILNKKLTRQVLGIISFLYTIDMSIPDEQDIITSFGLNVDDFIECVQELEELEITEIYDRTVVRISEQIIATYFFYDCFFRNPVLDFNCLLAHCYERNIYRLKDSVIPSINAFGEDNVITKMYADWQSFWNVIKTNNEKALSFMRVFSKYFPDLFFTWISTYRKGTQLCDENAFSFESLDKPHNNQHNDEILNLLETFYGGPLDQFKSAIFLSFDYARKNPETLAILIDKMKSNLNVNKTEILKGLPKISFVYNFLIEEAKTEIKFKYALYLIMDYVILRISWRNELYDKIDDRYTLKDILKRFRSQLLNNYLNDYESQTAFVRILLLNYVREEQHLKYPEIEHDFKDILAIIETRMDQENFVECYIVNKFADLVEKKITNSPIELTSLRQRFNNPTYELYSVLSMKYKPTDEKVSWEEFRTHKSKVISEEISVKSLEDFKNIYNKLVEIFDFKSFFSNTADGVAILIRSILSTNFELGMNCLEFYIQNGNIAFLSGSSIVWPILMQGKESTDRFFLLINQYDFPNKNEWINTLFLYLPEDQIDERKIHQLIAFYKLCSGSIDIYGHSYNKYEAYRTGTKALVMQALYNNAKNNSFIYKLQRNFFQESPELLSTNFELCQEIYLQQDKMLGNFDYDGRELMLLIERDNLFFYRYIDWLINSIRKSNISDHKILSKVWIFSNASEMVYRSLLKILEIPQFSSTYHIGCIFFNSIHEEYHEKAFGVLEKIVMNFPEDPKVLNMVIDTARNSFKQFYMRLIQQIITQNDDLNLFMKLQFHNNHFSSTGHEIWSDYKSKELREIKNAILTMTNHYKYFQHKNYLDERIAAEDRQTNQEKKYIFRGFW